MKKELLNSYNHYDNRRVSLRESLHFLSILLLCIGVVRTGFEQYATNTFLLLLGILVILLVSQKVFYIKGRVMRHFAFVIAAMVCMCFHFLSLGTYYSWRSEVSQIILYLLMLLVGNFIVGNQHQQSLWNIINFIAIFGCICIWIQYIALLGGIDLSKIPGLGSVLFQTWTFTNSVRISGIFSEPSHFAEFALISLYYSLFIEKKYKLTIFIGISLILSTSGLGIYGMTILMAVYALWIDRFANIHKLVKYLLVIGVILIGFFVYEYITSLNTWLSVRLLSGGTYNMRVSRSFELFNIMDWREKLFGIGLQNQAKYLNFFNIVLPSDYNETLINREYAQTFGYILCTTGIFGSLFFWMPIVKIIYNGGRKVRVFVLLFVMICLTCCIFSRPIFVLYLIVLNSIYIGEIESRKK